MSTLDRTLFLLIALLILCLLTAGVKGEESRLMRDPVLSEKENEQLSAWHFENPALYDFLFKRKPLGHLMTDREKNTTDRWMKQNPELFAKCYGLAWPERDESRPKVSL